MPARLLFDDILDYLFEIRRRCIDTDCEAVNSNAGNSMTENAFVRYVITNVQSLICTCISALNNEK